MGTCFGRLFWISVVLVTVFASGVPLIAADSSTESFHIQVGRGVFRLEHQEDISRKGQPRPDTVLKPDGTAFALRHNGRMFLITARHVVERPYDLRARVPAKRSDTGTTEVIELRIPKEAWVFHEQGPQERRDGVAIVRLRGVDVAVAPLPGIKDRSIVVFSSCSPCPAGESSQLAPVDSTPPASVLVAGFPGDLGFALLEQRPMFRSGIVALVAGERFLLIDGGFADERSVIIDRKVQPGNSGSPVFSVNQFSGQITLVGLVSASNEAWDYTIAEPASRIRETIERTIARPPANSPEWHLLGQ